jgi:Ca2+-binding EF-hand superfamily protein
LNFQEPFAPIRGQSLPLTFSDFCALIDLDVSQNAILKMQEAIKIFATFDADGSGAIDGEEVQEVFAACSCSCACSGKARCR